MTVHWLIESDVFPCTAPRITGALNARGRPWTRYHDDIGTSEWPPVDATVIFWGSLGAAYAERVAAAWTPGAVGNIACFHCSHYYPRLEPSVLANADVVFSTVEEFVADPRTVIDRFGSVERVFVRPDSPLKPFSGRQIAIADISLEALDHGFYYDDVSLPIVVSRVKTVQREWRFVIADGAVVTGCEYIESREGAGLDIPHEARAVAARLAAGSWQPARLYIADIGESDGDLRVIELNPFSGADLYDSDPEAVIDAVDRLFGK